MRNKTGWWGSASPCARACPPEGWDLEDHRFEIYMPLHRVKLVHRPFGILVEQVPWRGRALTQRWRRRQALAQRWSHLVMSKRGYIDAQCARRLEQLHFLVEHFFQLLEHVVEQV